MCRILQLRIKHLRFYIGGRIDECNVIVIQVSSDTVCEVPPLLGSLLDVVVFAKFMATRSVVDPILLADRAEEGIGHGPHAHRKQALVKNAVNGFLIRNEPAERDEA